MQLQSPQLQCEGRRRARGGSGPLPKVPQWRGCGAAQAQGAAVGSGGEGVCAAAARRRPPPPRHKAAASRRRCSGGGGAGEGLAAEPPPRGSPLPTAPQWTEAMRRALCAGATRPRVRAWDGAWEGAVRAWRPGKVRPPCVAKATSIPGAGHFKCLRVPRKGLSFVSSWVFRARWEQRR